jgi:hypothetical protein
MVREPVLFDNEQASEDWEGGDVFGKGCFNMHDCLYGARETSIYGRSQKLLVSELSGDLI